MRNKFGSFDTTVAIGEVLYQALTELKECQWISTPDDFPALSVCLKTTVHPHYIDAVKIIIGQAIAFFDEDRASTLRCEVKEYVDLMIVCDNVLLFHHDRDGKYNSTQLISDLENCVNVFIEKLRTGWDVVVNERMFQQPGTETQIVRQTKILDRSPHGLLLHDLLLKVSQKHHYVNHLTITQVWDGQSSDKCHLVGNPDNISKFLKILPQEITPQLKIFDQSKKLYYSCLNWLTRTHTYHPSILVSREYNDIENDLIDASFELISKHDEFSPYAGHIVLFQVCGDFMKGFSLHNCWSLYQSHPHIHVGLVFQERCEHETDCEYKILELASNHYYGRSRISLKYSGLKYSEFRIRKPTIDELEAILKATKLTWGADGTHIGQNSDDVKTFLDTLDSQIERERKMKVTSCQKL